MNSVLNMCRKSAKTAETISCCQLDHGSSDFRSMAGLVCIDSGRGRWHRCQEFVKAAYDDGCCATAAADAADASMASLAAVSTASHRRR